MAQNSELSAIMYEQNPVTAVDYQFLAQAYGIDLIVKSTLPKFWRAIRQQLSVPVIIDPDLNPRQTISPETIALRAATLNPNRLIVVAPFERDLDLQRPNIIQETVYDASQVFEDVRNPELALLRRAEFRHHQFLEDYHHPQTIS